MSKDQDVFDRMFVYATQQLQAEILLGRPWRFETVLMVALLKHEKREEQMIRRIEALEILSRL
jgi:hypothetical protein